MANVTRRKNSYLIRVSCGYDVNGKQVFQSMTWTPDEGMTEKQIEKELTRQTVLFEEACKHGLRGKAVKFEAFCEEWFEEYAKKAFTPIQPRRSDHSARSNSRWRSWSCFAISRKSRMEKC